jgi:potassium-dependent mechanosensitive channel
MLRRPRHNALQWCRAALLAAALALAGGCAVAQQPGPSAPQAAVPAAAARPAAADLDAFKAELDDLAHRFDEDAQSEDGLLALKQRLTPLRDQIGDHIAALEPRLKLVTDRLAQLGAAPAAGGSEDATLAAERSRLAAEQREVDGALKQARLLAERVDELSDRITARRRQMFTDRLFAHSANPLDPGLWRDAASAVPAQMRSLGGLSEAWAASVRDNAEPGTVLAVLLTLVAIAAGAWFALHWARRITARPTPRRFDQALSALVILCTQAVTAPALIAATVLVLRDSMLMPPAVAGLGFGLAAAVAVATTGRGVAVALFAPGEGARRLVPWSDQAAETYAAHLDWAAAAFGGGEGERDASAHRRARDDGGTPADVIEQVGEVVGERLDAIGARRLVGAAMAAAVVDQHRCRIRERGRHRVPERMIHAERMDEGDRCGVFHPSADFVGELRAVANLHLGNRHLAQP